MLPWSSRPDLPPFRRTDRHTGIVCPGTDLLLFQYRILCPGMYLPVRKAPPRPRLKHAGPPLPSAASTCRIRWGPPPAACRVAPPDRGSRYGQSCLACIVQTLHPHLACTIGCFTIGDFTVQTLDPHLACTIGHFTTGHLAMQTLHSRTLHNRTLDPHLACAIGHFVRIWHPAMWPPDREHQEHIWHAE
jgi:hypothetical protein